MAPLRTPSRVVALFFLSWSALFSTLPSLIAATPEIIINTNNRASVIQAYQEILKPALETPTDWTGNTIECKSGDTSARQKQSTLTAINFARAMVKLKPVSINSSMSIKARNSSLIGDANQSISHSPSRRSRCFSNSGYQGAKNGNISLVRHYEGEVETNTSATGARGVTLFLADPGPNNVTVGHRRWLLYSRLAEVGVGDTNHASTIVVVGGKLAKPVKQWIAWPSPGFFPRELEPNGRWSLSYPSADFRQSQISISGPTGQIKFKKLRQSFQNGDNTLSWDAILPPSYKESTVDYQIDVFVKNIKIGRKSVSKKYKVILVKAESNLQISGMTYSESDSAKPSNQLETPPSAAGTAINSGNDQTSNFYENDAATYPERFQGYLRPRVNLIGATACVKTLEGWEIDISWQLSEGRFIGRFNEKLSGLKSSIETWTVATTFSFLATEPPTGPTEFRTEGDFFWFMAMNGENAVIDEYWFPDRTESDVSGLCR